MVIDSHCDTPSQLLRGRNLNAPISLNIEDGQVVTFPKMKRGGLDGAFFALYTSNSLGHKEAKNRVDLMLSRLEKAVEESSGEAVFVQSADDARQAAAQGKTAVFLGIENASFAGDSPSALEPYIAKGVRYVIMTHARDNQFCDSCTGSETWGGLSPLGREMVHYLENNNVLVDVSHLSEKTFYDIISITGAPIIASHSCCKSLCAHPRNLTDDQIRRIRDVGGVVQVNFYPSFIKEDFAKDSLAGRYADRAEELEVLLEAAVRSAKAGTAFNTLPEYRNFYTHLAEFQKLESLPGISDVADHIVHIAHLIGPEYVGIGSDFDGIYVAPKGLEDVSCLPLLWEELSRRGFSSSEIKGIQGENLLKLL